MQKAITRLVVVFDSRRPGNHHRIAAAAKMRSHLLHPLKRRVACPGPADRVMRFGIRTAEFVELWQYFLDRCTNAVERLDLVERAVRAAFGRCTVVTDDVEDERVVGIL